MSIQDKLYRNIVFCGLHYIVCSGLTYIARGDTPPKNLHKKKANKEIRFVNTFNMKPESCRF